MPYILEVQRFGSIKHNGKFEHIGYMSKLFTTKKEAANYYDFHNSHLRKLNTHGTWVSDWDPMTKLRYIVRRATGEYLTVNDFSGSMISNQ